MKLKLIILILVFGGNAQITTAQIEARYLLGYKSEASKQTPKAYGSYARGCLAGGEELEINGPTWQVMRLSRGRNWGHPNMIAYLKRISKKVAKETVKAATKAAVKVIEGMGVVTIIIIILTEHCLHLVWLL